MATKLLFARSVVFEAAPEDRVDAVFALFESSCLSHANDNEFPRPRGLQRARMFPDDDRWYDVRNGMVLDFGGNRCTMIDALSPLTNAQMERIIEQLAAYVSTRLPDLPKVHGDVSENRALLCWSLDMNDAAAQTLLLSRSYGPTYLTLSYIAPE